MTFGQNLKQLREELGISQRELGERLGIRQQTIAQYEKATEQPKLKTIRRLAEALDIPLYKLVTNWHDFTPDELNDDFEEKNSHAYPHNQHLADNVEDATLFKFLELSYQCLNTTGRKKLIEYANDLSKISEYQKS